ncbi:MAG: hypothetical protein NZ903_02890, partial [Candidatus Micrarchaeota archaeon]|nr:hypothetical protein [Candidatus Micrarchaeota archaeon]
IYESFLGATLIAFNTTIPELALTLIAVRHKVSEIAIGNLIGSNIVNITLLLGINVIINPFVPNIEIASMVFGFIFLTSGYVIYRILSSGSLGKTDGIILIFLYAIYILVLSSLQLMYE